MILYGLCRSETRDREASTPVCNPEDVDSIGTWAQRVLFFPSKDAKGRDADAQERVREQERQKQDRNAESGVDEAVSPSRSKRSQSGLRRQESREEEEAAHAAWRWRFNRRWRHEQVSGLCVTSAHSPWLCKTLEGQSGTFHSSRQFLFGKALS